MRRLLRQPLVHFFALGALLFALYALVDDGPREEPGEIVVDAQRVAALTARFRRTWQRPPTATELEGLIDRWVREEVFYREGLALGLDRGDPVVRGRVAQKVEFMADTAVSPPGDATLEAWLEAHPERYRVPPALAFEQRFFDPERRGEALPDELDEALAALRAGEAPAVGDATLLPERVALAPAPQIDRTFGDGFAARLEALPVGRWAGPVRSGYGPHLVRVLERQPGRLPPLAEIRAKVERDVLAERVDEARTARYRALRDRYTVRIEAGPGAGGGES